MIEIDCLESCIDSARGEGWNDLANGAEEEIEKIKNKIDELNAKVDKLKMFCAKAYFDIYGGVRLEIYRELGDEIGVLMSLSNEKEKK